MFYKIYQNQRTNIKIYQDGTVTGFINNKPIIITEDAQGYLCVNTNYMHGRIHQLVYCSFNNLDKVPDGYLIHHKDHNKHNNNLLNLELITHKQHIAEHYNEVFSEENKRKISEMMKTNNPMKNPEVVQKVKDKLTGREGRKLSDEERLMHSQRMKDNNPMKNPEVAKRVSDKHRGKHVSEEVKQKISKSGRGKKRSEETKHKISNSKLGIKNPAFGRKWMHNDKYKYYAKPEQVEYLISIGFEFGYKKNLEKYVIS